MISIGLTGHRPPRLGYETDILKDKRWYPIIDWIKEKLKECGATDIYCGMAVGSDMAFAAAAFELKDEGYDIKIHCIYPCQGYNSFRMKTYPFAILAENADEHIYLNETWSNSAEDARDQYVVDKSDILFAIWDGNEGGGTYSTSQRAKEKGIEIICYPKESL